MAAGAVVVVVTKAVTEADCIRRVELRTRCLTAHPQRLSTAHLRRRKGEHRRTSAGATPLCTGAEGIRDITTAVTVGEAGGGVADGGRGLGGRSFTAAPRSRLMRARGCRTARPQICLGAADLHRSQRRRVSSSVSFSRGRSSSFALATRPASSSFTSLETEGTSWSIAATTGRQERQEWDRGRIDSIGITVLAKQPA